MRLRLFPLIVRLPFQFHSKQRQSYLFTRDFLKVKKSLAFVLDNSLPQNNKFPLAHRINQKIAILPIGFCQYTPVLMPGAAQKTHAFCTDGLLSGTLKTLDFGMRKGGRFPMSSNMCLTPVKPPLPKGKRPSFD